MKNFLLLLFLGISTNAFCQDLPNIPIKDGLVEYSEVVETSLKKEELYSNLKSWVASYFVSGKTVTELDDAESGKLIAKATVNHSFNYLGHSRKTNFRIMAQIDCKDSKYRYIIRVLEYEHNNTSQTIPELIEIAAGRKKSFTNNKKYALKQLDAISSTIDPLISSLKAGMVSTDDDF